MKPVGKHGSSTDETILVCGGAGFIGSNFVRHALGASPAKLVVLDKLTYAGSLRNLESARRNPRFSFVQGDIGDRATVDDVLRANRPRWIVNFAAETHVDRSIDGPDGFVQTNVLATLSLLEATRLYADRCGDSDFRILQVSTDEVYGSLGEAGAFREGDPYAPNSPYAATKAAADHLVRAYSRTYGLPALIANCSNNYGLHQHPEKLIPRMTLNAIAGRELPIYGDGLNVRDWLFVEDACEALLMVLIRGAPGDRFNIGGENERTNLEVVAMVCELLESEFPASHNPAIRAKGLNRYDQLRRFVADRPGHDRRYAIDNAKIRRELGWRPRTDFRDGLSRTVRWYLSNREWCDAMRFEKAEPQPRMRKRAHRRGLPLVKP